MSTWVLVGSPNSGKTTLYNWLTGAKSKAVNYPGSTVEYNVGTLRTQLREKINNEEVTVIDTPGVYSLTPQSEDEQVTHDVVFNADSGLSIDGLVVVLDATQLARHLLLAKQVIESGYPVLVVVTMRDLIEKEGSLINIEYLKKELGSNVVLFDGVLGRGLDEIIQNFKVNFEARKDCRCPDWSLEEQERYIKWGERTAQNTFTKRNIQKSARHLSNEIDKILLHPVMGFVLFFVFTTILFSAVYWAAAPVMDLIDSIFSAATVFVTGYVPGLMGEFLGSGLLTALGGVIIFVPQIFILFFGIGLLESTGYLARVAALIDKPLSVVGLGGRSFVPLLSGFACAIPAVMATRNISSKKEKLIAQSIIPFMTCSARLPVYALLIGFLYGDDNPFFAGLIMSLLYFGAIFIGAVAANVIGIFIKDKSKSRLLMELPLYRRPHFRVILLQSLSKVKSFLFKAGPIILTLAVVLWFATNFPKAQLASDANTSVTEVAQHSYAAQAGRFIEPVFKPMGVDWRVGFSLITAFAAREVFVSSLALMFNVDGGEEAQTKSLIEAMKMAKFPDGTPIFTTASVVAILLFFMVALQCISTVAILRREMGSWKPALTQLVLSNVAAYGLAVLAFNILRSLGY